MEAFHISVYLLNRLPSMSCVFIGYNDQLKGYKCFHPPTKKIIILRYVVFDETTFPFKNQHTNNANSWRDFG